MSKDFSTLAKPSSPKRSLRLRRSLPLLGVVLLALWFTSGLMAQFVVETAWFSQLGYLDPFWIRYGTKLVTAISVSGLSFGFSFGNLALAKSWSHSDQSVETRRRKSPPLNPFKPQNCSLRFRWLLPIALGLSGAIGLLVVYNARTLLDLRRFAANQSAALPLIPHQWQLATIWQLQPGAIPGQAVLSGGLMLLVGTIALLVFPSVGLRAIALLLSLEFGYVWAANWSQILLFFHATLFDRAEPLFGKDIGFYVFNLPIWQLAEFWLLGLSAYTLLAVTLWYLLSGDSLSQGAFVGFTVRQQQHLCSLSGCFMLAVALAFWIGRYTLLYSQRGVVFGAAYAEVHVQLPVYTILAVLAIAIAVFLFWQALQNRPSRPLSAAFRTSLLLLGGFLLLSICSTSALPFLVERFIVQPNELTREQLYIRRNIALTREAFNLENIQVETFNPSGKLTRTSLQTNRQTLNNIRLWDTRPLLQTNRQLQQIRPYYRFFDADIDRYTLAESAASGRSSTANQQVLISARELDYSAVPAAAKTWVNEHLVYTHGYGFTLTPVNKVAPGGLPDYFVKDIGTSSQNGANLSTSSAAIRASIPIGEPRIYYGEITNTYTITGTQVQELDYPSGNDNVYNIYDGAGGLSIASGWNRWIYARYLRDWQMLLTSYFTPNTKVMVRRNIQDRIRAIAPFLRFDGDPYLVTADIGCRGLNIGCGDASAASTPPNYLYWVIDAYTISDHYPYSEPSQYQADPATGMANRRFNYIRNSVKVVVDAYNGSVNFYVTDPIDPILRSWAAIFPHLFKPLAEMPASLRSHLRYPIDLFSIQSERLLTYHMTDPQVFYNKEDQWEIPNEIYGSQPQRVEPYFLITNLPTTAGKEEFVLLLPFKPTQRTNLIAWLAARSDAEEYGKQLLYVFPKQRLIYGTEQIEARINQDPVISQKISLWNRQGSRVRQGNLLVIPIEQSLLYVEPLYLEAEQNSLPTLVSVIVAYENRIVMADTLEQALETLFQDQTATAPPIVRPVE